MSDRIQSGVTPPQEYRPPPVIRVFANQMNHTTASQLPDASLLRRVAAWIYDLFLLFAVGFSYAAIFIFISNLMGVEQQNLTLVENGENMTLIAEDGYQPTASGPLFQIGLAIVLMAFYVIFWITKGATLGMQTWRLELIDLAGNRPNIRICLLRCVLAAASFLCFGLGYLWSLIDSENRTMHDIISRSRVVVHPKIPKKK